MSNYKTIRRPLALLLASVIALAMLAGCSGDNVVGVVEEAEPVNWWEEHEISLSDQLRTQENTLALFRTSVLERKAWLEERWAQAAAVSIQQVLEDEEDEIESPISGINRLEILVEQIVDIDSYRLGLDPADRLSHGHLFINRLDSATQKMFDAYWLMNDVITRDKLTRGDIVAINARLNQAARALEPALPPAG